MTKKIKKSSSCGITNAILWLSVIVVYSITLGYVVTAIVFFSQENIFLVPAIIVLLICVTGLAVVTAQMLKER